MRGLPTAAAPAAVSLCGRCASRTPTTTWASRATRRRCAAGRARGPTASPRPTTCASPPRAATPSCRRSPSTTASYGRQQRTCHCRPLPRRSMWGRRSLIMRGARSSCSRQQRHAKFLGRSHPHGHLHHHRPCGGSRRGCHRTHHGHPHPLRKPCTWGGSTRPRSRGRQPSRGRCRTHQARSSASTTKHRHRRLACSGRVAHGEHAGDTNIGKCTRAHVRIH